MPGSPKFVLVSLADNVIRMKDDFLFPVRELKGISVGGNSFGST